MQNSASDDEQDLNDEPQQWEEWQEEGEDDAEPTPSLFAPSHMLPSPQAAIQHDAQQHGFNILEFACREHLDEYDIIRLINYIRHEVKLGRNPLPIPPSSGKQPASWQDDRYLLPVLPEDPLLCFDFLEAMDHQQQQQQCTASSTAAPGAGSSQQQQHQVTALREENRMLRDENEALREMVLQLRLDVMPPELRYEVAHQAGRVGEPPSAGLASTSTAAAPTAAPSAAPAAGTRGVWGEPGSSAVVSAAAPAGQSGARSAREEVDASYFDSYSGFNIHREMISDKPRTDAYRKAIEGNPSLIRGKRVLDVGCGTGILSLFAARAGASHVIAVDGSPDIAKHAVQIAKANGYSSESGGPMSVISARVEQLGELPGGSDKVDTIVSEWMGYGLLFETMLDSVLAARDRWLAPGGVLLPDTATIHVAGAGSGALGLQFWQDVYGFSMAPIAQQIAEAQRGRANVLAVEPSDILTDTIVAKSLDLCTMKSEDQDFTTEFVLTACSPWATNDTVPSAQEVHALVLWFDTAFSAARCPEAEVVLSTSPFAPTTHWAQTVLPLKQPITLAPKGIAPPNTHHQKWAQEIKCRLSMARNPSRHRSLDISLEHSAVLADGTSVQDTAVYAMSVMQ